MTGATTRAGGSAAATPATRGFASALSGTREWLAWEEAAVRVHGDPAAQSASAAYEERSRELRLALMLNAARPEEKAELERLHDTLFKLPSVLAYAQAEAELKDLCGAVAERLSAAIGLDLAGSCSRGCCS